MHKNYSILGALFQVIECSNDLLQNAELKAFKFRAYQSPLCSDFPGLQLEKFPSPVQDIILEQVNQARKWMAQGEPLYTRIAIPGWRGTTDEVLDPLGNSGLEGDIFADLPRCECRWFRAWQLPCSHIWHHHLLFGSLVPSHLAQLAELWATNGYEIYEEIQRPFQSELDNVIGIPARVKLDWRERLDLLNAKFHAVTDWLDEKSLPPEAKKLGLQHFINEVSERLLGIEHFDMESWYREQASQWES
jgi:hypothetical protein